jgi:predicted TIM-barrel fold metal-dependent hydrolase
MLARLGALLGGAAAGALALEIASVEALAAASSPRAPLGPIVDFHVHLFGVGDGGTGCFLSAKQKRHVNYFYLLRLLGLEENGRMDEDYVDRLIAHLRGSSVSRAVLLAQDCRYDDAGRPDLERTSFHVPNDHLFAVVRRFPDLFVPCVSINPRRRDALDEVDRCAALGARVLKIHPPTQDVDPGDPRHRPFYRRCAERRVIVMVHTGTEHAAEITGHENCDPARLAPALEEGCTVVAAHSGLGNSFDREDFLPSLVRTLERFPRLYCETANLSNMLRWRNLPRLLREPLVLERLLHASDFPFPPNALVHWSRLRPATLLALLTERNLIERDLRLKIALGFPPEVFERGAKLLG